MKGMIIFFIILIVIVLILFVVAHYAEKKFRGDQRDTTGPWEYENWYDDHMGI